MDGKLLLLNGGGLDSIAQLIIATDRKWDVASLHIDYGQDAAQSELHAAALIAHDTNTPLHSVRIRRDATQLGTGILAYLHPQVALVPGHDLSSKEVKTERAGFEMEGRNLMLLSIALSWAAKEYDYLMLANNKAPAYYPDATQDFILHLNKLLIYLGAKPRVWAPFANLTKMQAVCVAFKINPNVLRAHSCYKAQECGVCPHCLQKKEIAKECVG